MALGSTQPLTEMSTRNLPGRPACKADNLTAICEPIVQKMWELRRLTTLRASKACYRDSFTFLLQRAGPSLVIFDHLIKKVPVFMWSKDSLTHPQQLDIGPYPEPDDSDPYPHILFTWNPL
jgi:hypothetical protein